MAPKSRAVTAKALQSLLVHIGAPSSGTKAVLQERFQRHIGQPRFSKSQSTWEALESPGRKLRITSIDMGIKNLAFCEAEVSYPSKDSLNAKLEVLRWEKINLTAATREDDSEPLDAESTEQDMESADEDLDPYSVDALSKTAYGLVKSTILAGSPDIILIEKQRWRSGGGSAVQQWTVRVNTLEGMLWAVLQTLYTERLTKGAKTSDNEKLFKVFSADPKRVGQYWLARAAGRLAEGEKEVVESTGDSEPENKANEDEPATKKKPSKTKAEKKAKIALLRSWLTATPASTASVTGKTVPGITFKIAPGAEATRQALCSPSKPARRKKTKEAPADALSTTDIGETELKKLDDITDCFLQAAAWVSWESNHLQLQQVWQRKQGSNGNTSELTEDILLQMIDEIDKP
jgi:cruciform cutting endonuclease 1